MRRAHRRDCRPCDVRRHCPPPCPPPEPPCSVVEANEPLVVRSDDVAFGPLELPGFPPGAEIAILYGNPFGPCTFFVARVRFPAGYVAPAHFDSITTHVTVLEGALVRQVIGGPALTINEGDFFIEPAFQPHTNTFLLPTVVDISGVGPFVPFVGTDVSSATNASAEMRRSCGH